MGRNNISAETKQEEIPVEPILWLNLRRGGCYRVEIFSYYPGFRSQFYLKKGNLWVTILRFYRFRSKTNSSLSPTIIRYKVIRTTVLRPTVFKSTQKF